MKRFYLLLIGLIAVVGYSNAAFAFDLFKPTDTDWLVENIINKLFDPEKSPFGAVSGVFLAGVLAFGGILAGYTMLVGTMNTAHDGEMLGKRWSTMWIPVRTTLGVAMILPIKNGFCAIQIIVVWLATQGIGLADQTWDAFVDNPLMGSTSYTAPATAPGLRDTYAHMVASAACVRAVAKEESKLSQESSGISSWLKAKDPKFNVYPIQKEGVIGYNFGSKDNLTYQNYCGSAILERKEDSRKSSIIPGNSAPKSATILIDVDAVRATIFNAQSTEFVKLFQNARALGYKMADDPNVTSAEVKTEMDNAVKAYTDQINAKATEAYNSVINKNVQDAMKEDGFASAGAWFLKIVKAQDLINYEINNIPQVGAMTAGMTFNDTAYAGMNAMGGLPPASMTSGSEYTEIAKTTYTKVFNVTSDAQSKFGVGIDNQEIKETSSELFNKFLDKFVNDEAMFSTQLQNPTEHPIVIAINIGNSILTVLSISFAVLIVPSIAAPASLMGLLGPFATTLFISFAVPAMYLCVYLPLLPFIIWSGTIIGWLILVVEALFAAPLWAVAHLAPDGDGVVGKQGQGYMIILSLVLRPVLMVLGFVVSISLMVPAGQFINHFFAFAVAGAGSTVFTQILITIGSTIVYCIIIHNIMKKMLGLIHSLPDSILQWIGGAQSKILGEYSSGIEGESSNIQGAVVNQGISAARSAGQQLGGARDKRKSILNSDRQQKEAEQRSETERDRHSEMISAISGMRGNSGGGDSNSQGAGGGVQKQPKVTGSND
jgi:conjugal transfer/type IV secretion protein DotA/TraY